MSLTPCSISHSPSPYSSFYPSLYHSISPSLSFVSIPSSLSSLLPPSHYMTLYSPSILPSIPLSISPTSLCLFPPIILLYPPLSLSSFLYLSLCPSLCNSLYFSLCPLFLPPCIPPSLPTSFPVPPCTQCSILSLSLLNWKYERIKRGGLYPFIFPFYNPLSMPLCCTHPSTLLSSLNPCFFPSLSLSPPNSPCLSFLPSLYHSLFSSLSIA